VEGLKCTVCGTKFIGADKFTIDERKTMITCVQKKQLSLELNHKKDKNSYIYSDCIAELSSARTISFPSIDSISGCISELIDILPHGDSTRSSLISLRKRVNEQRDVLQGYK